MTQARIQTFFTGCCHAQLELQEVPETWNTTSFGRQIPAAPNPTPHNPDAPRMLHYSLILTDCTSTKQRLLQGARTPSIGLDDAGSRDLGHCSCLVWRAS